MDTRIFEDLGLTNAEIKVYLTLMRLGSSAAGKIIEKTNLQTSVVHRALNSLIEKSLINYVLEGRRRLYQATRPESFLDFIEDKKEEFKKIIPEIKETFKTQQENASVYKGVRGIKEVYSIMINNKGKEYLTFGGGPPCIETMGITWWFNMHKRRIKNKLSSRQVFDEVVKYRGGEEIASMKITNVRYVSKEFAQFQETVIVGDYVAISVFNKESPYSFLIKDKHVAEGYRKHFEIMWGIAKA